MTATEVVTETLHPLAPQASAQVLAAMPMPAADVPAVAWWAIALAALWLSGVLLMALRTFGEWRRCRALLAAAYPCEDQALVQALQLASDAHGVRPAPRLWMSTQVDSPQLVGPFRPVLLLPAGDNALQGDALDLALTHELQHLQRRDLQWGCCPHWPSTCSSSTRCCACRCANTPRPARKQWMRPWSASTAPAAAYGRLLLQLGVAPQPHLGVASAAPSTTSLKRVALAAVAPVLPAPAGDGVDRCRGGGGRGADAPGCGPGAAGTACAAGRTEGRGSPPPAPKVPPAPPMSARAPAVPVAPAPPAEPADVEELSGPDDADVAVDVDVDVDPGIDGGRSTSRSSSITTYGRLDLGQSPSQAFVLVDGDSTFANGGIDDVTLARKQLGKGPALWFRQGDKRYVVRDPMMIQTLQRAYSGAVDLGRQQSELGRQQSALGREQGELGKQMGEMGRLQSEEARRIALAAAEAARNAMAAHDINREAAAEAAKAARGATSDIAVAREAAREAAAEARRAMQEARSEAAQSGRTRDMQRLARQQSELANRQAALGSQQAALGERQARVHAQASQQAQQVIARALASGKAERL